MAHVPIRSLSKGWTDQQFRAVVTASSNVLYRMNADWSEMRQLGSTGFLANTNQPANAWLEKYIPSHEQSRVGVRLHRLPPSMD